MARVLYVLHSALAPESVPDVLRRSIDQERRTLFSFSGYRGDHPLLGEVGNNTFRVQKRRYGGRNDFTRHFYARFAPEPGGTRVEGYFDIPRWKKYLVRTWLGLAVLIGTPIFMGTVIDVATGSHYITGEHWVGLVVPPVLLLFGTVLPKVGGKADQRFILEQLQNALVAHNEEVESHR